MGTAPRGLAAGGPKASAAVSFLRFQSLGLYIAGSYRREIYKRVRSGAKREAPVGCSKHFAELLIKHKKPRGRFCEGSGAVGCRSRLPVRPVLTHLCVSRVGTSKRLGLVSCQC